VDVQSKLLLSLRLPNSRSGGPGVHRRRDFIAAATGQSSEWVQARRCAFSSWQRMIESLVYFVRPGHSDFAATIHWPSADVRVLNSAALVWPLHALPCVHSVRRVSAYIACLVSCAALWRFSHQVPKKIGLVSRFRSMTVRPVRPATCTTHAYERHHMSCGGVNIHRRNIYCRMSAEGAAEGLMIA
jgi:hypothetical protein